MTTWATETIDSTGDVGSYCALVVDSSRIPHALCYDATAGNLNYYVRSAAPPAAGTWAKTVVASDGDVGRHAALAIDSSGTLHAICYDVTNQNVLYFSKASGGAWSAPTTIEGSIGWYANQSFRIKINPATGYPAALFLGAIKDRYAEYNGASWDIVDIGGITDGKYHDFCFEANGDVHLTQDASGGLNNRYYQRTSGVWGAASLVGVSGEFQNLILFTTGQPWMAVNEAMIKLSVGKYADGAWDGFTDIDTASEAGDYISMDMGGDSLPAIAYQINDEKLWFAKWNAASWDTEVVQDVDNAVGSYLSLSMQDEYSRARIAYYDLTAADFLFAYDSAADPHPPHPWTASGLGMCGHGKVRHALGV